jgi:hypothetical protein
MDIAGTYQNRVYEIRDVPVQLDANRPYLEYELVKIEDDSVSQLAQICPGLSIDTGDRATVQIGRTQAAVLIEVVPDFSTVSVKYRAGNKTTSVQMDTLVDRDDAFGFVTPALTAGSFTYQICYQPAEGTELKRRLGSVTQWCVPSSPVSISVQPPYPSPFRLQPGVIVVNQARDVRLSAHMVFLVNRAHYFGPCPLCHFFTGGGLNPMVGLQVGGSNNQIVALLGGHLRLIDEAGLVFGFRFGNDAAGTPYRWDQNLFFGFSLDPGLFTSLRGSGSS